MNPILDKLQSSNPVPNPQPNPISQMWNMYKTAQNPQAVLNNVIAQNPMLKQIVGNGNPKETFYAMCSQRGVDPDSILSQLE